MSRWVYPACQHAPDACLHSSEEDMQGVQQDIQDEKEGEDHVLAHKTSTQVVLPPSWLQLMLR